MHGTESVLTLNLKGHFGAIKLLGWVPLSLSVHHRIATIIHYGKPSGKNRQKSSLKECVFLIRHLTYSAILSKIHFYRLLFSPILPTGGLHYITNSVRAYVFIVLFMTDPYHFDGFSHELFCSLAPNSWNRDNKSRVFIAITLLEATLLQLFGQHTRHIRNGCCEDI